MAEEQRQQPPKKQPKASAKTKGANAHKNSIFVGDSRRVTIKALDAIGAVGLAAAFGIFFTSHKTLAVVTLFVALSSFIAAVYLTWLPALKKYRARKRKRVRAAFIASEILLLFLCFYLHIWIAERSPQLEQPTFRERPETVAVSIGGVTTGYPYESLISQTGTPFSVAGFIPVRLHIKD